MKAGYDSAYLIGWAEKPYYYQKTHKVYWVKELKFTNHSENSLNYNIRILGKKGFIDLSAVAGMSLLPRIKKDLDKILASVNFTPGNQYEDFDASLDKIAAFGIGGLIAGKVFTKPDIWDSLLDSWQLIAGIILGGVGVLLYFRRNR